MKNLGLFIALGIFVIQLFLIPGSGMTWDEPSSFFFGRANLMFWMTGNRAYLDDFKNPTLFPDSPFQYIYGEDVYPPVPFVISSAFSSVLAEKLHVLTPIDAHHLGEVVIATIAIACFYYLLREVGLSVWVSTFGTLIYALYPTIFGQMRSDAKDIPLMSFLVIAVYWYLKWRRAFWKLLQVRLLYIFLFALSFGLALGSKPTALILILIIGLWSLAEVISMLRNAKTRNFLFPYIFDHLFMLAVGIFVGYFSWPWLWDNPIAKIQTVWTFFKTVGYGLGVLFLGKYYQAGVDLPKIYPYAILLFQTPPTVMVLFLIGLVGSVISIMKKKHTIMLFFLIWFAVAMGRFLLPNVLVYARVRHFIDAMPAFFVIVAFGLERVIEIASRVMRQASRLATRNKAHGTTVNRELSTMNEPIRLFAYSFIGVLVIGQLGWIIVTHYPFEPGYYNMFVGGTKNIAEKRLFDADYWGSGVQQSMEYIQGVETQETYVYSCQLLHLTRFYGDKNVRGTSDGNKASYVIVPNSPSYFGGPIEFHMRYDDLVYTVKGAGAPMFYVFKRKAPTFWNCGAETESVYID